MDARVGLAPPQVVRRSRVREGQPFPLGATWDGLGVNFALFSAHATRVELCLFDDAGETELERVELPELSVNSSLRHVSSSQAAGGALCSDDLSSVGVFLFSMGESCISRGRSRVLPTMIFARNLW